MFSRIITLTLVFQVCFMLCIKGQNIKYKELTFFPAEGTVESERAKSFRNSINERDFFIYEITDRRVVQKRIGAIQKSNITQRYYKFPMDLESEVRNLLVLSGFTSYRDDKDSIKLEIERFEYNKSINEVYDKGSIILTINFFSTDGTFLYQYNLELPEKTYLANPTNAIKTIHEAIFHSMYVFNNISPDFKPFKYTNKEVSNYSQLFNRKLQKGFYASYDELILNNPSMQPEFWIDKLLSKEDYHRWEIFFSNPDIENQKQVLFKNCIGFSDGEEIYVNSLNYGFKFGFNPVLEKGRYLYFNGRSTGAMDNGIDGAGIDAGNYFVAGFFFGLAGGLALGALSAIPVNYEAIIDLKSSKLYILDDEFLDKIVLTVPNLKEQFSKNPDRYKPYLKQLWIKEINKFY